MTAGISIVIPTLDEAAVIGGTLRQFAGVRGRLPLEVIVSDDGSADETVAIARPLADVVIENATGRRGRSGALNRGARRARHEILVFLDADLRIDPLPEFLAEALEVFEGDPDVVGGMMDFFVFTEEATAADRWTHRAWNGVMRGVLAATGIGISTPGFQMGRRAAFERIGGFDESLRLTQDVDYSLRLSRVGRIHYFGRARILESPRRYRHEGYWIYTYRSLLRWWSILVRRRSYGEYVSVRSAPR